MRITVLGCGSSAGTPCAGTLPGEEWGRADSSNSRNRRRRSSLLLEQDDFRLLIDTGPDLREQMLLFDIRHVHAVLFTHSHADHCHGMDELRPMIRRVGGPIDAWMDSRTHRILTHRFAYAFSSDVGRSSFHKPLFVGRILADSARIGPFVVRSFTQDHGCTQSLGLRIGTFAYSTDAVDLNEDAFRVLSGVQLWIVGALRDKPSPYHAHLEKVLRWIARVRPSRAVLTHMSCEVDYDDWCHRCPSGVMPGYDGLRLEV